MDNNEYEYEVEPRFQPDRKLPNRSSPGFPQAQDKPTIVWLPIYHIRAIESDIKNLLHGSRHHMREQGIDTSKVRFDEQESLLGIAMGIIRCVYIMGYGYFGPSDQSAIDIYITAKAPEENLSWWLSQLKTQVLTEEGFKLDNKCDFCYSIYGWDHIRTKS